MGSVDSSEPATRLTISVSHLIQLTENLRRGVVGPVLFFPPSPGCHVAERREFKSWSQPHGCRESNLFTTEFIRPQRSRPETNVEPMLQSTYDGQTY